MIHTIKCFRDVRKYSTKVHFVVKGTQDLYKALSIEKLFLNSNSYFARILVEFMKSPKLELLSD